MWATEVEYVDLEKGEKGLGFSILDYQVMYICFSQDCVYCMLCGTNILLFTFFIFINSRYYYFLHLFIFKKVA
jgi:hypothetical protein